MMRRPDDVFCFALVVIDFWACFIDPFNLFLKSPLADYAKSEPAALWLAHLSPVPRLRVRGPVSSVITSTTAKRETSSYPKSLTGRLFVIMWISFFFLLITRQSEHGHWGWKHRCHHWGTCRFAVVGATHVTFWKTNQLIDKLDRRRAWTPQKPPGDTQHSTNMYRNSNAVCCLDCWLDVIDYSKMRNCFEMHNVCSVIWKNLKQASFCFYLLICFYFLPVSALSSESDQRQQKGTKSSAGKSLYRSTDLSLTAEFTRGGNAGNHTVHFEFLSAGKLNQWQEALSWL